MAADIQQHGKVAASEPPKSPIEPVSAKPVPLTEEERKQRIADLRERLKVSRYTTVAPAGKVGYWARKNDQGELGRLDYLGFSIVHDDPKAPRWKASGLQTDGTYQVADVMLLEIDADLYQLLLSDNQERATAQIKGATEAFKAEAAMSERRTGYSVPTFERGAKLS